MYPTDQVVGVMLGLHPDTFRKYVWGVIACIPKIKNVIYWENRLRDDNGSVAKITVDGTDFRIKEIYPFNKKYFSHKFKGPGLRYEVGVNIQTGDIVWLNGPFPCGLLDIKIARLSLVDQLLEGERIVADGGYRSACGRFDTPSGINCVEQYMRACARARHEGINAKFKNFNCMKSQFRHDVSKHKMCFMSVAICTQLEIILNNSIYQVYYNDRI